MTSEVHRPLTDRDPWHPVRFAGSSNMASADTALMLVCRA
jgi:hypothetical protein